MFGGDGSGDTCVCVCVCGNTVGVGLGGMKDMGMIMQFTRLNTFASTHVVAIVKILEAILCKCWKLVDKELLERSHEEIAIE